MDIRFWLPQKARPMKSRRSDYDVSNTIKVTSSLAVRDAVCDIFRDCYPAKDDSLICHAFETFKNLFEGHQKGYHACDTYYHDKQHTLDMTLAFARLFHGHEKQSSKKHQLNDIYMSIGVITALFHDAGYIRKRNDHRHFNGAEYTRIHVSRSATFLRDYLLKNNLGQYADTASTMVHYTGYEVPLDKIRLKDIRFHMIGYMIGTADLIAQMADRCYLEKCRDRLYPEFQLGGMTEIINKNGDREVIFSSAEELLIRTPDFYQHDVLRRLSHYFKNVFHYAQLHFDGANLYMQAVQKNIRHIEKLINNNQLNSLCRIPPENLACPAYAPSLAKHHY